MIKLSDIVKIKDGWENSLSELKLIYKVVNVNYITRRCYIEPINSNLAITPQELVSFDMIDLI